MRCLGSRKRAEVRITKLSRWRFETLNLVVRIEFNPLKRQAILVIECEDLFLAVDRRAALDIEGMDGDKTHPMPALHPTDRLQVVSLHTYTPDIAMPSLNPASSVTYGPAPWDGVGSQPCTNYPLRSGNRVPLHPVANGCRKTRGEGIWIHWIKRCKRVDQLRCSEPGGSDKVHLHYMCGLPARSVQRPGSGNFVGCLLPLIGSHRFPASSIRRAGKECALSLHACQAGKRCAQSGGFHHVGHGRRSLGNPICYPLVPLGKWAGRIRAGRV